MAFHPSGLHLVIALQDKIYLCNVLSNTIQQFKTIGTKGCNEIQFSNGGHLFASILMSGTNCHIQVYNFYTGECSERMTWTGHTGRVMGICWREDDMGFTTCGLDGNIYFYDLYGPGEIGIRTDGTMIRNSQSEPVRFSSVVNIPSRPYQFIAVGSEKKIYTNNDSLMMIPRPTADDPNPSP